LSDPPIDEAVAKNYFDEGVNMQTFMTRGKPAGFYDEVRTEAARQANRDDAQLWRWFCVAYQDGRIRWCRSSQGWLVSVDHKHLATEPDFDAAIRVAHAKCSGKARVR
jgi:hypothetical protein